MAIFLEFDDIQVNIHADPAYGATSALAVQSALCIVNEQGSLPQRYSHECSNTVIL